MTGLLSSPGAVWSAIVVALNLAIVLCALLVLPGGRRPQTAMAWLILILALPFLGFLLFLLFGRTTVGKKRRELQVQVNEAIMAAAPLADLGEDDDRPPLPPLVEGFTKLNQNLGVLPMTYGNSVELIDDYGACVAAMTEEVAAAERFVNVQFYISAWDEVTAPFFEALVAAVQRGVEVRFLFDHIGSKGIPVYKEMLQRLEGTGIRWAPMLPIRPLKGESRRPDLRNHRKILVVDDRVAFSGSQNLIEACYDKPKNQKLGRAWVELMARIEGPAVQELNVVFATDWLTETGESLQRQVSEVPTAPSVRPDAVTDVGVQVVPSGPGFVTENNLRLFNSMIYSAERKLSLTSPYFVPDDSLLYAITTTAQRGVDVELFVGATAEPFVLHAKHFSVDDKVAVVGSSNMDMRSFALNYEVVMMMTGADIVARLGQVQDTYRSLSTELTLDTWV